MLTAPHGKDNLILTQSKVTSHCLGNVTCCLKNLKCPLFLLIRVDSSKWFSFFRTKPVRAVLCVPASLLLNFFFTCNRVLCTCGKIPWYSARNMMRSCWPSQPISALLSILGLLRSFCFALLSSGNKKHGFWGILLSNQTEFFEMLTVAYCEIIIHSLLCFVLHLVSGHCTAKFVGLQWEAEDFAVSPFRSWNLIRYPYFICVRQSTALGGSNRKLQTLHQWVIESSGFFKNFYSKIAMDTSIRWKYDSIYTHYKFPLEVRSCVFLFARKKLIVYLI